MEVVLMVHTPSPEWICAVAMLGCQSKKAAFELEPTSEKVIEMIKKAKKLGHISVLEHASFTFSVKGVSRSCTHQLVRHRLANYSQQSLRHVNLSRGSLRDRFVYPPTIDSPLRPCVRSGNKSLLNRYDQALEKAINTYEDLIESGVPVQDARCVLPIATVTNITITMNARELLHFFFLRCSPAAQWEIREMANKMLNLVKDAAPTIFEDGGKYKC